jgi:NIMA (never in mitosis gene a)-related kinase
MASHREIEIAGEVRVWRLRKHRVLGKGSFGLATLYERVDTGEFVVVKELNLQCITKPAEIEALHSEIAILKKTSSHPNIVKYYDSCFDGQFSMMIVMEYCDDGDLGNKIEEAQKDNTSLSESFVSSIFTQVLAGLAYLHVEHRILHRDLKPQNIFLTTGGVAKIGDFGVSTMLAQSVEFAKTFCGSPYYLAPELCEERPYNGKADLWSVGVILYELMTLGAKPFHGKTLVALILAITRCEYQRLTEDCGYSKELRDVVHSLLQLNPTARPTLKRLLRSPVVLANLQHLPEILLESPYYERIFMPSPLHKAKAASNRLRAGGGSIGQRSAEEAQIVAEIEAWATGPKGAGADADDAVLLETLKAPAASSRGPARSDGRCLSTEPPATFSARPNAKHSPPKLAATAQPLNEDEWNALYEDDKFEDDDDEGPVVTATLPLSAIGYKI